MKGRASGVPTLALVAVTVVMAGLFLAVMPIRTYLSQRHSEATVSRQLAALEKQNSALSSQVKRLNTASQIEQIARTNYGLVQPGEQSYVILPMATSGSAAGDVPNGTAVPSTTTTTSTTSTTSTTVAPRPPDAKSPGKKSSRTKQAR